MNRYLITLLLIAIFALGVACKLEEIARYNDMITRSRDMELKNEIERQQQAKRIEELEKELRLIHTDIDIMQNGSKK
jgi:hypothetical protein